MDRLGQNLFRVPGACNVYVIRNGHRGIAVDLGDGRWVSALGELGIEALDHVFLTHHHADQVGAPAWRSSAATREAVLHAPAGEERFLDPEAAGKLLEPGAHLGIGCPASYSVPAGGAPAARGARFDMAGFTDLFWGTERVRFLHTPGHSPYACSVLVDVDGRSACFVGDALHAGGTIWEPYHLEWDHWTGSGVLAAWEGVQRLRGVEAHLICPSHGPIVTGASRCAGSLKALSSRLMDVLEAKGAMYGRRSDTYVPPVRVLPAYRQYSDRLFQFGTNGYLIRSRAGGALVVDPTVSDLPALRSLLADLGAPQIEGSLVTHYHADHCDGAPALRQEGARVVLHPWVAEPLANVKATLAPWLPLEDLHPDELWPETGDWKWQDLTFRVAPFPGQTLWHCAFAARIDGNLVAFVGDTFQPPSRWNGTGGFCAFNRSLFRQGFDRSARLLLDWRPHWLAAGHGTVSRFDALRFRAVRRWSRRAEERIRALCPSGDLERDYYHWGTGGPRSPYRPEPRLK